MVGTHADFVYAVIPFPHQSVLFVGSSSAPQHTTGYAFVASILVALITSLI